MKTWTHLFYAGALCLLMVACQPKEIEVRLADYLQDVQSDQDATPAFRAAIEACRQQGATRLVIGPGTYRLFPNLAEEKYLFVSNNDPSLKRILFNLSGMHNLEIDGEGALLLFSGYITPFLFDKSQHISVKNLSIDYTRTFHTEGTIVASGPGWVDLSIPAAFPYRVTNGRMEGCDAYGNSYPFVNMLEFDAVLREPALYASDYWLPSDSTPIEERPDGSVRVFGNQLKGTVGNTMVLGASKRLCPGFVVSDSQDIKLTDVNIYHCGGMGVIAQRSRDITLTNVNVVPAPNSGRMISITADATHFSNCGGDIQIINCTFTNQKDDATNIHGIYAAVTQIDTASNSILVKLMHDAQWGFDFIQPGNTLEFVNQANLITFHEGVVKHVQRLNKEYTRVEMEAALPTSLAIGNAVAVIDTYPNVLIKGCRFEKNRARGLLLGSRGHIVIEDNFFHIAGAAILLEGDARYWYEQSGVRDLIIRNNVFENGNYGYFNWGRACISVGTGMDQREGSRYHRNLTITGNTFRVFDPRILNLYCTDSVSFKGNTIERTTAYSLNPKLVDAPAFVQDNCAHVSIE